MIGYPSSYSRIDGFMVKDIRWKQRFQNFEKAFLFLENVSKIAHYDELQSAGLLHSFEFTFELAWKTLQDYLKIMGITAQFPREGIKQAFATDLIENGHVWIEMLDKLGELTHTYNEEQAKKATEIIKNNYCPAIKQIYQTLKQGKRQRNPSFLVNIL